MTTLRKRIGLTGGIGAGKSTVAKMFAELGATIIDADQIARDLMSPGEHVLAQTVETFGQGILATDGSLNRQALADIVFKDPQALATLNSIVHPAVRERSAYLAQKAANSPDFSGVIIEDIPLLAETDGAIGFDAVIVVYADEQVRLDRLVNSRAMLPADAKARIATQATDEQRKEIASWVIDNSLSQQHTYEQVIAVWAAIQAL